MAVKNCPANIRENWMSEARSYLDANFLARNPVEMATMSVMSDVQECIGFGDYDRATFLANVAKVLVMSGAEMAREIDTSKPWRTDLLLAQNVATFLLDEKARLETEMQKNRRAIHRLSEVVQKMQ